MIKLKKVIGITGGIACGKSTITNYLKAQGYFVLQQLLPFLISPFISFNIFSICGYVVFQSSANIQGSKKKAYQFIQTVYDALGKTYELKGLALHIK